MAEDAVGKAGKGFTGFLSKDTAGLPNWAWVVVIGAGLAAAYVLPKFFGNSSPNANTANTSGTGNTDTSGIGLAVDPTTGLPYAVEGLVPSGGTAGGTTGGTPGPEGPPGPTGPTGPAGTSPCTPLATSAPAAPPLGKKYVVGIDPATGCPAWQLVDSGTGPTPTPTPTNAQYVTATQWPNPLSSLSSIASKYGLTLARIEQLNPQITNPNLIHAGQKIRIA